MLSAEIKNDAGILQQVRIFIDQLRAPFGFLTRDINEAQMRVRSKTMKEMEEEKKGDHKYFQ